MATKSSQGAAYAPVTQAIGPDEECQVKIQTKPSPAQPGLCGVSKKKWIVILVCLIVAIVIACIVGIVVSMNGDSPSEQEKMVAPSKTPTCKSALKAL